MKNECFIVICKDDFDESEGMYTLATRRTFPSRLDALTYAAQLSSEREPIAVYCPKGLLSDE
jgi:hypothetical protein